MPKAAPSTAITHLRDDWRSPRVPDGYTVALVGDMIVAQPIAAFLRREASDLLDVLAGADLVVGNLEGTIVDLATFDGYPAALSGFGWLNAPPEVAADLAEVGLDMVSRANNHCTDWGVSGLLATDGHLRAAGLTTAGTGHCLSAARAPGLHVGPRARTSLVSFATTFEPDAPAADALGPTNSRPGASTLALTPVVRVSPEQLEALRAIRDAQPVASRPEVLIRIDEQLGVVTLFGQQYAAEAGRTSVEIDFRPDAADLSGILLNVRQAKQTSDFTLVASHTHQPDNWTTEAPAFLRQLAARSFDSGADVFVAHGPHQLRGIEIVDGRPAFYSLGNFCFMDNTQAVVARGEWERRLWHLAPGRDALSPASTTPAEFMEWRRVESVFGDDVWFESAIPLLTYAGDGRLRSVRLLPIQLGNQGRDAERGIPRRTTPEHGTRILRRLQALSEPLGTPIQIDESTGEGTITVDADD